MKNHWFSFTALLLALVAIVLVCSHACVIHGVSEEAWNGATKDYIGTLITMLGVIIAFVVGFQIYNAVDLKDRLKKLEEEKDDLKTIWRKSNSISIKRKTNLTGNSMKPEVKCITFRQTSISIRR